jgi:hypothetical protein
MWCRLRSDVKFIYKVFKCWMCNCLFAFELVLEKALSMRFLNRSLLSSEVSRIRRNEYMQSLAFDKLLPTGTKKQYHCQGYLTSY